MGDPTGSPDVSGGLLQQSSAAAAAPPLGSLGAPADGGLLRAALERLVLLECRADLTPKAGADAAGLELSRWRAEAQRAQARASSAEAQRDRLFSRLMEAGRVHTGLAGEASDVDLASFIADLRSELARVEQARATAERDRSDLLTQLRAQARPPTPSDSPQGWAERLSAQGLLPEPGTPLTGLEADLVAGSAAERALLSGVLRDLTHGDERLRALAAERLSALPALLSAPVFAAALSREAAPAVLALLVRGAGLTRVGSLGPLLMQLSSHVDARVRAAVLFAEVRLAPAAPAERWLSDPAARVRRRAALAAALHAPSAAAAVLEALAADAEAGVREAVAAAASSLTPTPTTLLLRLAQDEAPRVRRTALRALGAPPALAEATAAERRRALREQLKHGLDGAQVARRPARAAGAAQSALGIGPMDSEAEAVFAELTAELKLEPGEPSSPQPGRISPDALEGELRSALRGRSATQLAEALGAELASVTAALEAAADRFLLRGQKWFAR